MVEKIEKWLFPLLLLATVLLYLPSFSGLKIWDDNAYLKSYFPVTESIFNILISFFRATTWPIFNIYAEIMESRFSGNIFLYHANNISLHLFNAVLLNYLLRNSARGVRLFTVAVFLVHPIQVISVAWIVQVKTLLSLTFTLLSAIFLERFVILKNIWSYVGALLFYFLAIKTKSAFVFFPLVFTAFIFYLNRNELTGMIKRMVPFFLMMFYSIYSLLNAHGTGEAIQAASYFTDIAKLPTDQFWTYKIALIVNCIEHYVLSFFTFANLKPIYGRSEINLYFDIFKLLIYFMSGLYFFIKANNKFKFIMISFVFLISPFLGIIMAPHMGITPYSDQHQYLSIVFIAFGFKQGLDLILTDMKIRRIVITASFFSLMLVTFRYMNAFNNEKNFYNYALLNPPVSIAAVLNLSIIYSKELKFEKAYDLLLSIDVIQNNFTPKEIELLNNQKLAFSNYILKTKESN